MRVKPFHRKVMLGVAVLAAAGLGAGLTAGLASAAGPYVAQGAVVDLCIGTSGTALTTFTPRRAATRARSAAVMPATCSCPWCRTRTGTRSRRAGTSGDVVTVGYPGAQTATESEPFDGRRPHDRAAARAAAVGDVEPRGTACRGR